MIWLRLLTTCFVILCPPQSGTRLTTVAERAEEHTEAATAVDVREILGHRQVVQPPRPALPVRLARRSTTAPAPRRLARRFSGRFSGRFSDSRRVPRRLLYADDADDDDPARNV